MSGPLPASLRPSHVSGPSQVFLGDLSLRLRRVHECTGNARRTMAMILAGQSRGDVFWVFPSWLPERMNPQGMLAFANPGRFTFVAVRRPEDMLWTMEEILRSGAVPLAVIELPFVPGLTPVRRLQLAAETGAEAGRHRPLGLILTPGEGGAPAIESRWRMTADHRPEDPGWILARQRHRSAPPARWRVTPGRDGFRLDGVAAAPEVRTAPTG